MGLAHLAVRSGHRVVFLSLAGVEFLVVVNLPVCSNGNLSVLTRERLRPTVGVHDRQPLVRHATDGLPVRRGEYVVTRPIRTTVTEGGGTGYHQLAELSLRQRGVEDGKDSTAGWVSWECCVGGVELE